MNNRIEGLTVAGVERTQLLLSPPIPGPLGIVLRPPQGVTSKELRAKIAAMIWRDPDTGKLVLPLLVTHGSK